MTVDEHISFFVQQAAWLEHEYEREIRARRMRWNRIAEIRMRNQQLTREFLKFMETHKR